jgi:hypothetical protein
LEDHAQLTWHGRNGVESKQKVEMERKRKRERERKRKRNVGF